MTRHLKKLPQSFFKQKAGAATVEFTLTIVIFLAVLGSFLELARLSILSAYIDSSTVLAVREVKNTEGVNNYGSEVERKLNTEQRDWNWLNNSKFSVQVRYYGRIGQEKPSDTVQNIINKREVNSPKKGIWAEYIVSYHYKPMFSWFPKNIVNTMMQRNLLVLQEYER
ncbi:TadE/TadG family type IV pilus assembly protein [Avibacterium paragallinarum]|uniref:TadE/TadG family type IV pilus assembly protein n=1 Tax=Avibacterium paragallinarum TaxID=728 RepID=UPI003987B1D9